VTVAAPLDKESARAADAQHAARSGAVQVLTVIVQAMIFFTRVTFARLYGQATWGGYVIVANVAEMFTRGGAAGAPSSMLRYVASARAAGDQEGVRRALGAGLRLCLLVAGIAGVGLALGVGNLFPKVTALNGSALRLLAPVPVLVGCLAVLIQATLAARVTRANFWVRGVFEPTALLVAGVSAWALGGGLRGLAMAQVVASAATLTVALLVVRRIFHPAERRRVLGAPPIPGFARLSLSLGIADILNTVLQRADVLIVGYFAGPEWVAVYDACETITRVIANVRYAFDSIMAGMMSESLAMADKDRLRYGLRLVTRWVITAALPIALTVTVLRAELLLKFYGRDYAAGASALLVLALSHLANASLGLTGWMLVAGGKSRFVLLNNVLGVIFNIGAGILLTSRYGITGTAIAVLGTALVVQGSAVIEVALWQRISPFGAALWKPLVSAAIAVGVELVVSRVTPAGGARIAAVIAVGVVAYFVPLVLLGLPPEEHQMYQRLRTRLRRA
jgi:O-antigen/teichoic acid export membrane protein